MCRKENNVKDTLEIGSNSERGEEEEKEGRKNKGEVFWKWKKKCRKENNVKDTLEKEREDEWRIKERCYGNERKSVGKKMILKIH